MAAEKMCKWIVDARRTTTEKKPVTALPETFVHKLTKIAHVKAYCSNQGWHARQNRTDKRVVDVDIIVFVLQYIEIMINFNTDWYSRKVKHENIVCEYVQYIGLNTSHKYYLLWLLTLVNLHSFRILLHSLEDKQCLVKYCIYYYYIHVKRV